VSRRLLPSCPPPPGRRRATSNRGSVGPLNTGPLGRPSAKRLAGYPPLAYSCPVWFVETSVFTQAIETLIDPEGFRELQSSLIREPAAGDVIPGTRGIRKLGWSRPGTGKRGGIRVIYYWITEEGGIYLLYAYSKARQAKTTELQIRMLRRLVEEEFK